MRWFVVAMVLVGGCGADGSGNWGALDAPPDAGDTDAGAAKRVCGALGLTDLSGPGMDLSTSRSGSTEACTVAPQTILLDHGVDVRHLNTSDIFIMKQTETRPGVCTVAFEEVAMVGGCRFDIMATVAITL